MTSAPLHDDLNAFVHGLPKAELHLHIGGTLEPEMMLEIARRNDKPLPFTDVESARKAYRFDNLQEFLDLFHAGTSVLMHERDYYELTSAYLDRVHDEHVRHVEVFFDAQTHTERGIPFATVINGIHRALRDAEREHGISFRLIPSFLRHLGEEAAFRTFEEALEFREIIDGFGLASSELGFPPSMYRRVFDRVRKEGFHVMAHAGEEGPPSYIWEALEQLKVERIDHGNRCLEDDELVEELVRRQVPLTLCPLSNLALKVIPDMSAHPIREMLDRGLMVTVHSDDPAYFGGYLSANYIAVSEALGLGRDVMAELARNSFRASFLSDDKKAEHIRSVDDHVARMVRHNN